MNLVFMGTPDFAVESLKQLYEAGHNIMAVVSQPDKPVGRGMKYVATPTKAFAVEKGIEVYQPEKIKGNIEFINQIKSLAPDCIVVVAYGKILPKEILQIPKIGCINVHGSLLPKYRGAAPIQWAIINGESETGVTTMYMDIGMDTGDMLLKESIPIEATDTYGSLYEKLKTLGGELIVKTLEKLESGNIERIKQPDEFSTAPMIFRENCKIEWDKSAYEICNLVRGVNPAPGAWTSIKGNIYKIWYCEVLEDAEIEKMEIKKSGVPGEILISDSKKGLIVLTGNGVLSIKQIQAPNAKKMNILDYLRGNSIEKGCVMGEN